MEEQVPVVEDITIIKIARKAVHDHLKSDIEVAIDFCENQCSLFLQQSCDRLVKVGRSIRSLIVLYDIDHMISISTLYDSLQLVKEECNLLISGQMKVPKVQFGLTGIDMPIVTLGCMRFQQEWGPRINDMNMIYSDCQNNVYEILKYSICTLGMNHIETARGYGCSELQIGVALQQLYKSKLCSRTDLIIQTKVPPYANATDFRIALELSFTTLQIDYIDLFAFHGFNYIEQVEWVFGNNNQDDSTKKETCYDVIQEYIKNGKIRHLGFSTHGSTELIIQLINTNVFEYVNIHYHYFGSYTASCTGNNTNGGLGNLDCIKLLHEKNMGIFIISPFDKGGKLYDTSKKLRTLTLPEMEPMSFQSNWLWNHHNIYKDNPLYITKNGDVPLIHTYTVGAGRPSDLDQPAIAAYLHMKHNDIILTKVKNVTERLDNEKVKVLGQHFMDNYWKGFIPKNHQCITNVEHNQLIWLYICIKVYGLYEFAKARYNSFETNYYDKWDELKSRDDNIIKIGQNGWGYVPGIPLLIHSMNNNYENDLQNVEYKKYIIEAELFVYTWCRDMKYDTRKEQQGDGKELKYPSYGNLIPKNEINHIIYQIIAHKESFNGTVPNEWNSSYDMRPWPDYPDQAKRN